MGEATSRDVVVERFREAVSAPALNLFEGALLISQLIDPTEDMEPAKEQVEDLARRVLELRGAGQTPERALRRVLFQEEHFRGDGDSYDDPENSSISRVLGRRKGMPITLSILVLEVGRRAGLRLTGVGLPGHFVVGGPDLPPGRFLDPFEGGKLCDTDDLSERVGAIFGTPVELPPEIFAPDSTRAILTRVLFNLRRSYDRRDLVEEALATLACAEALEPGEPSYLRERGLLLLKSGRSEEALKSLEEYVAVAKAEDVEAVTKLIGIVREQALPSEGAELVAGAPAEKHIFSFDEARDLLPKVKEITSDAVFRYARIGEAEGDAENERRGIVREWAREILSLGAVIKGLWLVDFDSGAGYYCWKYPEPSLEYFHEYEEGFAGRLPIQ